MNKEVKEGEPRVQNTFYLTCQKCGEEISGYTHDQTVYNFGLHIDGKKCKKKSEVIKNDKSR